MPPTTRSMVASGVVAPEEYAVRQKKAKKPEPEPDPNLTKHGQIGFDRKALQVGGALESDTARPPTLANEVLKLFRKEQFVFDEQPPPAEWDQAYENMKPAFRLVSRWMTHPIFREFWDTLVHEPAERSRAFPGRPSRWEIVQLLEPEDRESEVDYKEIPNIFDFTITHQFRFLPISHAWAETRSQSIPDPLSEDGEDLLDPSFTSVTFLHKDFLDLSYTDFPKATKSQQLRFLYFLAVTVGHEMAHLVWQLNWTENQVNCYDITESVLDWEPYYIVFNYGTRRRVHNELGIVWEWFMFGGRIQPLNQSLSPFAPDGLVLLPMDMVRHTYFWDPQCSIAPLRTRWISDQFSEAWWRRKGKRGTLAREPGRARVALVRATVNRTIDSSVFQDNEYDIGEEAQRVAEHVLGGSPGSRVVKSMDDTWLLTGVVRSLWGNPSMDSATNSESESESESEESESD